MVLEQARRIEFHPGLVLEKRSDGWHVSDPTWMGQEGSGRTWLALIPFTDVDEALSAIHEALPAYLELWEATLALSATRQKCYRVAMAATFRQRRHPVPVLPLDP